MGLLKMLIVVGVIELFIKILLLRMWSLIVFVGGGGGGVDVWGLDDCYGWVSVIFRLFVSVIMMVMVILIYN